MKYREILGVIGGGSCQYGIILGWAGLVSDCGASGRLGLVWNKEYFGAMVISVGSIWVEKDSDYE